MAVLAVARCDGLPSDESWNVECAAVGHGPMEVMIAPVEAALVAQNDFSLVATAAPTAGRGSEAVVAVLDALFAELATLALELDLVKGLLLVVVAAIAVAVGAVDGLGPLLGAGLARRCRCRLALLPHDGR